MNIITRKIADDYQEVVYDIDNTIITLPLPTRKEAINHAALLIESASELLFNANEQDVSAEAFNLLEFL